jgi:hypothetical protein
MIEIDVGLVTGVLGLSITLGGVILWWAKLRARFLALEKHDRHDHEILQILVSGQLATLDGLKQLGCNGEVSKALDALKNHIISH